MKLRIKLNAIITPRKQIARRVTVRKQTPPPRSSRFTTWNAPWFIRVYGANIHILFRKIRVTINKLSYTICLKVICFDQNPILKGKTV